MECMVGTEVHDVGVQVVALSWTFCSSQDTQQDVVMAGGVTLTELLLSDSSSVGKPSDRQVDDIQKIEGKTWLRHGQVREIWHKMAHFVTIT